MPGEIQQSELDPTDVATRTEQHEAEVWARCVELAARIPGDPLGAILGGRRSLPLTALTKVPSDTVNRVVGLGVTTPATTDAIEAVTDWYRSVGQPYYRVEVAPVATPPGIGEQLRQAGLEPLSESVTKVWRDLANGEVAVEQADVSDAQLRELTHQQADEVAALNVRAWGAWRIPVSMSPWFSATVGHEGFRHYGVYLNDRLVSTGALAIHNELAWIGFDATHPRLQSRSLRHLLTCRRIADAEEAGCRIVHAEAQTDALTSRARLLQTLYVRQVFVHSPSENAA